MHISDGILPIPVWAGSAAAAAVLTAISVRRFDERRIPQVAVLTGLFFTVSSIAIPVGPSSWHLLLNGLVGLVLGWDCVPSILLALFFQRLLLGDGGILSLGANTLIMAGGALAGFAVFSARRLFGRRPWTAAAFGFLAGASSLVASGAIFYAVMAIADPAFRTFSLANLGLHAPLLLVEPPVTAFAAAFLLKVKPELLDPLRKSTPGDPP